nr:hypothetical protein [Micromonospora sp. HNM0581]
MRAVMFDAYDPPEVLNQVELPTPVPKGDQVLIREYATTVTTAECGTRRGEPRWGRVVIGLRRPRRSVRVLGLAFAGEVTALGPKVLVIGASGRMAEIVEAHRHVDSGHKLGNVVIDVVPPPEDRSDR